MPSSTCPTCGKSFHLSVSGDVKEWYAKFVPNGGIGDTASLHCFECWKQLKPYDVVEVIAIPGGADDVTIGDLGTVLEVLNAPSLKEAYEVECVLPDGSNKWHHAFTRAQLCYSIQHNKEEAHQSL